MSDLSDLESGVKSLLLKYRKEVGTSKVKNIGNGDLLSVSFSYMDVRDKLAVVDITLYKLQYVMGERFNIKFRNNDSSLREELGSANTNSFIQDNVDPLVQSIDCTKVVNSYMNKALDKLLITAPIYANVIKRIPRLETIDDTKCSTLYVTWDDLLKTYCLVYNPKFIVKGVIADYIVNYKKYNDFESCLLYMIQFYFCHEVSHIMRHHLENRSNVLDGIEPTMVNIVGDSFINISLSKLLGFGLTKDRILPVIGITTDTVYEGDYSKSFNSVKEFTHCICKAIHDVIGYRVLMSTGTIHSDYISQTNRKGIIKVRVSPEAISKLFSNNSALYIRVVNQIVSSIFDKKSDIQSVASGSLVGNLVKVKSKNKEGKVIEDDLNGNVTVEYPDGKRIDTVYSDLVLILNCIPSGGDLDGIVDNAVRFPSEVDIELRGEKGEPMSSSDSEKIKNKIEDKRQDSYDRKIDPKTDMGKLIQSVRKSINQDSLKKNEEDVSKGIESSSASSNKEGLDSIKNIVKESPKNVTSSISNSESDGEVGESLNSQSSEVDLLKGMGLGNELSHLSAGTESEWNKKLTSLLRTALGITEKYSSDIPSARIEGQLGREEEVKEIKRIVMSIDCSSSMGPKPFMSVLMQISSFLKASRLKKVKIDVLFWGGTRSELLFHEFNNANNLVNKIKLMAPKYGSTHMIYSLEYIATKIRKPDAIIYFTDGQIQDRSTDSLDMKIVRQFINRYRRKFIWVLSLGGTISKIQRVYDSMAVRRMIKTGGKKI